MTDRRDMTLLERIALSVVFWLCGAALLGLAFGVLDFGGTLMAPPWVPALAGVLFLLFGFAPLLASPGRDNSAAVHALVLAVSLGLGVMAAWVAFGEGGEGVRTSAGFLGMTSSTNNEAEGRFGFAVMTVLCGVLAGASGFALVRRLSRRRD